MFDVKNFANGMYKVNSDDAKKWANKQAKFIAENPEYTSAYELDFGLCIAMGFEDGFDPNYDDGDIVNPDYPSAHLCMKVCEYKPYDLDFEYLNMPYNEETGDVWDTDISVSYDGINSTVDWLIDEYYEIVASATYKVTVSFNGVENTYDTEYLDEDDAREDALESAQLDLSIVGYVHEDNDGNYYADVIFCDNEKSKEVYYDTHHTYEYPEDAEEEILWEAAQDLEIVSVESDLTW